jgi:hypothetical protein
MVMMLVPLVGIAAVRHQISLAQEVFVVSTLAPRTVDGESSSTLRADQATTRKLFRVGSAGSGSVMPASSPDRK